MLAALATAALAVVSWRLVERPALRWARHRFRSPAMVSAASHGVAQELPGRVPPTTRDDAGEQAQGVRP